MRFFLDKSAEHLNKGLEFQQKGEGKKARYHYLKASEFLFQAAKKSEGSLREQRLKQAKMLLEKAKSLGGEDAPLNEAGVTAPSAEGAEWMIKHRPKVRFSDVAGLEEVKEQVNVKLIYPFTHPDQAKKYGVRTGGGLLLYGPPGTGKTMIAQAVANEIEAAFFTVKPSEIMSKWVGEAEQNIQKLFSAARSCERAIIFIDEVESLIPKRRHSGSTVMQRVVPQILAELEGFEAKKGALLFMGATNEPWSLDSAVLRPGRFDEKIYVPLPDLKARRRIVKLNLKDKPLADDVDLDQVAGMLEGYSGADLRNICTKATNIPFVESIKTGEERNIEMRDLLSVIHETKPSVSPKDIERFEKFNF